MLQCVCRLQSSPSQPLQGRLNKFFQHFLISLPVPAPNAMVALFAVLLVTFPLLKMDDDEQLQTCAHLVRISHLGTGRAAFAEAGQASISSGDFLALVWWYSLPLLSLTLLMHYNILISSDYTKYLCQSLRKSIYKNIHRVPQ